MVCFNLKWFVVCASASATCFAPVFLIVLCSVFSLSLSPSPALPFSLVFIFGLLRGGEYVDVAASTLHAGGGENSATQQHQLHTVHRVQFNRNVLFVLRLVRCGFYWIFLLHLRRGEQIYWQYRFSEFLILAICRFFHDFRNDSCARARSSVPDVGGTGTFFSSFLWITGDVTMFHWCEFFYGFSVYVYFISA